MQNYGGYPPSGGPGGYPPPGGQGYHQGAPGYPPGSGYPQPGGPGFPPPGGAGYPGAGPGAPPGAYGQPGYPSAGMPPNQGYPGMAPGGMAPGGMMPGGMAPGGMMPGGMAHGGMMPGGMAPGGMGPGGMPFQGIPHGGMPQQMGAMYGGPPIQNPPIPFETQLQGGLVIGRSIVVSGMAIPGNKGKFTINFQEDPSGENIALHFNPRINAGPDSNVLVLNTKSSGSWGDEDRGAPYFPFGINQQFEIRFIVDQDRYRIFSNNKPFCDYPHRIHPPQKFGYIRISGDVQIHQIRFE